MRNEKADVKKIMMGAIAATSGAMLVGCNTQIGDGDIDQSKVCQVGDVSLETTKAACEPGQKVAFLPRTFGNEQLPVLFAAVNCDHRYQIAMTKGGVSCIYNPMEASGEQEAAASEKGDSQ